MVAEALCDSFVLVDRGRALAGRKYMPLHSISLLRLVSAGAVAMSALSSIEHPASAGAASHSLAASELAVQNNQRRLVFGDLIYRGGFRLPAERSNDDSFAGGGQALAFNP